MNKEFIWTADLLAEFIRDYGDRDGKVADLMDQFKESKQPKPEWEIWAYQHKQTKEIAPKGSLAFCNVMYNSEYKIYSIKRLSDNSVWALDDKFIANAGCELTIKRFDVTDVGMQVWSKEFGFWFLEEIKKPRLFTTEDGVGICKGDDYYFINTEWEIRFTGDNYSWIGDNIKAFSSKEKAEEYTLMNKPLFSISEILSNIVNHSVYKDNYKNLIISLAKEKLNKP